MVRVLKEQDYGAKITSTITKESSKTIGSIFVDDTDLVKDSLNSSLLVIDDIAAKLQNTINWWEGCIKFTGRVIRREKSFAYLLDYKFKLNGEVYLNKPESLEINLEVRDSSDVPRKL